MRRFTAAAAVAAFGLTAAACAPPAEEEQGPQGDTSVNIGWNQPFYSYNDDTTTGNATANANILYLIQGEFNYYNPDLELVQDESYGTYEKVSDDPLTVKYTVDDDMKWSDGTAVDAADMMLQWAALSGALNTVEGDAVERDPETGAPYYQGDVDGNYGPMTTAAVRAVRILASHMVFSFRSCGVGPT